MTDDDHKREKLALKILARLHHYTLAEHYEDHVNDIRIIADALKDATMDGASAGWNTALDTAMRVDRKAKELAHDRG